MLDTRTSVSRFIGGFFGGTIASLASVVTPAVNAYAGEPAVAVGVVAHLSGPFASTFGLPARNAAELVIDALNAGHMPAPYNIPGFGGAPLTLKLVDEAGGTERQIDEYRNLVEVENVDLVVGYVSDRSCKAVAPLSAQLQRLTVFFECGASGIFDNRAHRYLFRTGTTTTMRNAAAASYVAEIMPAARSIAGLNADLPSGGDSWVSFQSALRSLMPAVQVRASATTGSPGGGYEAEISVVRNADIVHSSLWGNRAEAFIRQGTPRGLFSRSTVVLTAGESTAERIGVPDGTIVRASGPFTGFAVDTPLQHWFQRAYQRRFSALPDATAYKMARAILGVKSAWEKAQSANSGVRPSQEQVIAAFENLRFEGPDGTVAMHLGRGHQAAHDTAYGRSRRVGGRTVLVDVRHYPAAGESDTTRFHARTQP
jgi:branched-chain amino acid transport system substrate-binding protein